MIGLHAKCADSGRLMYQWATDLFPICRSITGPGVRFTLDYILQLVPLLSIHAVPSDTKVFDWTVPEEWTIHDAWIEDYLGNRVVDFANSNLHVVGYSEPVDICLPLSELQNHLYSLPEQPDAIPYVTSYYQRSWGFCLTHRQRESLQSGNYRVNINSTLSPGVLNYGEIIIKGDTAEEILLSTYICHPSMANNEISGPVVTAALARWLMRIDRRRYTYRILFVPETIGSIVYLSRHYKHLKKHVVAGFNITCVGDSRCYSYLPTRRGGTLADRAALHALRHIDPGFKTYTWLDRGSDERQYCSPGLDLPIATIMRSKYGEYPEYHTSLDNLSLISPSGLEGSLLALQNAIMSIELNCTPRATTLGEPQLSRRGLYPTISSKQSVGNVANMMHLLTLSDGQYDLLEISEMIGIPILHLHDIAELLASEGLLHCSYG